MFHRGWSDVLTKYLSKVICKFMNKKNTYLIVIFLIVASCVAFGRIAGNDFINCDDKEYITENYYVQSGFNAESIRWVSTSVVVGNWHPLTMLSLMLDWSLFGANPAGHHMVNLLLHIGAVLFLFLFLNKTTNNIWPSAFAAAFLALHPLRVESVAWAAERKDVLSMFFGMACLYAYAVYAEKSKISQYFLSLLLFVLSLLSKPMMVTLPFVLMLLDYWPLGRWQKASTPEDIPVIINKKADKKKNKQRKADSMKEKKISMRPTSRSTTIRSLLWEKAPFIFLIVPFSMVTLWAQNQDKMVISLDQLSVPQRFSNAIVSYVAYLGKIFYPVNLAVFYPFDYSIPLWQVFISVLILIVISLAVFYYIKKQPFLFVGWFWYLGTLFPVIGLVKAGMHEIADRYTYLPSIGIAIMLAWGLPSLIKHEEMRKKILLPAAASILAILTVLTWQQCGYWKNSLTLFDHASQITKNNYLADNHVALALLAGGKNEDGIDYYSKSISIKPDYYMNYLHRGAIYIKMSQNQRALEDLNKVISLKSDFANAYANRAFIYTRLGQYKLAIEDFNKAVNLKPDYAEAYYNRAYVYFNILGNKELGCYDAQKACELGQCKALEWAKGKGYCR
jgi:protein O-mannosyl-transferase